MKNWEFKKKKNLTGNVQKKIAEHKMRPTVKLSNLKKRLGRRSRPNHTSTRKFSLLFVWTLLVRIANSLKIKNCLLYKLLRDSETDGNNLNEIISKLTSWERFNAWNKTNFTRKCMNPLTTSNLNKKQTQRFNQRMARFWLKTQNKVL